MLVSYLRTIFFSLLFKKIYIWFMASVVPCKRSFWKLEGVKISAVKMWKACQYTCVVVHCNSSYKLHVHCVFYRLSLS